MKKIVIGGISVLLAASEPLPGIVPAARAAEQMQNIITLNLNGGTLSTDSNLTFNTQTETILPTPTRENYSFAGWYDNANFSGTAVTILPTGSVQNNITYYARWEPAVYSIEFETYGGSIIGEAPNKYTVGTKLQLPDKVTKENYDFVGWYDNPEFTGEPYNSVTGTGNQIFYAKWKAKSVKITLNLNGGVLPEGTALTFDIGTKTALPVPTREDYSFAGWYNNDSFQGIPVSIIEETDYGSRTLYAKWIPNKCNVTLNLNGGSLPEGTEVIHIPGTVTALPTPVYEGFTFEGWYLAETFAGEAVSVIPADASGSFTYYAKWSYKTPAVQPSKKDKPLKAGALATAGKATYMVNNSKKHTATFIESYNTNIIVPDTVKLSDATYKVTAIAAKACKLNTKAKSITIGKNVTSIGKYAFDGCGYLKKITVKSTCLKTVGKNALHGIHSKCVIKVPGNKLNTYKKLFKKKGQAATVKIKKCK